MNTHKQNFSNQDDSDINNVWAISEWADCFSDEKLKGYVCKIPEWTNIIGFSIESKNIICLISEWEKQARYALCKKTVWATRLLNTLELRKLNQVIKQDNISDSFSELILSDQYKQSINSSINKQINKFSNGKYTYTSNRWQKFDVTIENKQAIEIKPHGSILLWSNVWAIKRCITLWFDKNFQKYWELENQNKPLNDSQTPTQKINTWLVVHQTQSLVQQSLEKNKIEDKKFNDLKSLESQFTKELMNFIDYNSDYKPTDIQFTSAQNVFVIFSERTNTSATEMWVLLNNPNITWLIFQSIENNLKKELSDDTKYLNLLIQLLWKVKEVFSWYLLPEKPVEELNETDKLAMIDEIMNIHKMKNKKRAYH